MRTQLPFAVLAAAVVCSLFTVSAHARARTFVASYGNDSNPCTFGSPCKTFQQAVNVVDAGGEVTAIDSAGFGPLVISHSVTITSPTGVEAGIVPTPGNDAIQIVAGSSDKIVLRGLTLEGNGSGNQGVAFDSGAALTVIDCVVKDFSSNSGGILVDPSGTSHVTITNTVLSNNGYGVFYSSASGSNVIMVLNHVTATDNGHGLYFFGFNPSTTDVAISNSVVSNNSVGIDVTGNGGALTVSVDNTTLNGNGTAIFGLSPAAVMLSRSVIQGNGVGTNNQTSNTFYTYSNNLIDLNGQNFMGGALYSGVTLR